MIVDFQSMVTGTLMIMVTGMVMDMVTVMITVIATAMHRRRKSCLQKNGNDSGKNCTEVGMMMKMTTNLLETGKIVN